MALIRLTFTVLRAVPDAFRGEALNFGVVIFSPTRALVRLSPASVTRLKVLHPNYAAWQSADQQVILQNALDALPDTSSRQAMLGFLVNDPEPHGGEVVVDETMPLEDQLQAHADALLTQLVEPHAATRSFRKTPAKRAPKLAMEIRDWLKRNKAFSSNMLDLSKHRVVANYPVDLSGHLYADLALQNGRLHVMEVLDLRGITHLTAGMRGDAAVKGITLDQATANQANAIAIVQASDYGVAKPAIGLVQRYAKDVYDFGQSEERSRFATFISSALHIPELIGELATAPTH